MALNMTKGLIPLDFIEDDIIDVSRRNQSINCRGYDWLGNRPDPPEFLVLHRAQMEPGATLGSPDGYFKNTCCPALTDLECNSVTGRMRRFVRRGNAPSGWANGTVNAPYGDALAYLNLTGWDLDKVNRDGEACEVTGWFAQPNSSNPTREDPVSDAAKNSLARWMASRAHDYGITWETFPLIPSEGNRSYLTWHDEWTAGTGKVCPGRTLKEATPDLIERARAIMKAAQEGTAKPPTPPKPVAYAKPVMLDLGEWDGRDRVLDGITFHACKRTLTARTTTRRYQLAAADAPSIGPDLKRGDEAGILYIFQTADNARWAYTEWGTRLSLPDFTPYVRFEDFAIA